LFGIQAVILEGKEKMKLQILILACLLALVLAFFSAALNDYFDSVYQHGAVMKQKSIDYWRDTMESNRGG